MEQCMEENAIFKRDKDKCKKKLASMFKYIPCFLIKE